jgi:hypothetical protein
MKEKFIPGTQKKYSITSDGLVYSNYKNTNNGGKFYEKKAVSKYLQQGSAVLNLQIGKFSKTNKPKVFFVNTLMKEIFKLKKPDVFHMYDLKFKNGDALDNSLDNLEWKIRCNDDVNFYPQPYYNKKSDIISKCCSHCGKIHDINRYVLQKPNKPGENSTYKNKCKSCMHKHRWISINSDEHKLFKFNQQRKAFTNSEKGKIYHKQYSIVWKKKESDKISDYYISENLKINIKEITPELREVYKKKITLKRKLENHGNKEN